VGVRNRGIRDAIESAMAIGKSVLMQFTVAMGTGLAIFATSWAQMRTPDTDSKALHTHWREYVNSEYRISFLYPDTYKPVAGDICQDNYYRRYLLCLAPPGGSDPVIDVTVIVAAPFHVSPGAGDVMPTRERIGRHIFYCGLFGSMGVGFSDGCALNLKGKTLEFQFAPLDGMNVNNETKQIEATMLKSLRTF
jgi:hypothetical protein